MSFFFATLILMIILYPEKFGKEILAKIYKGYKDGIGK